MREAARKIKCPVLVIHPARDAMVPYRRRPLARKPHPRQSRFVQIDSENHMPLDDEPAWPRLVDEVRRFLAEPDILAVTGSALPLDELTPRERAVLEGIAEGQDNTEIAASLGISEKTVRNHITRVFDKIGVEHRYQAIVRAREAGLGKNRRLTNPIRDICPRSPRPKFVASGAFASRHAINNRNLLHRPSIGAPAK